jgi:hypothetical protein
MFSYCGDVLFPVIALGQIESLMAENVLEFERLASAQRHSEVVTLLKRAFEGFPKAHQAPFSILHASRQGSGMDSQFRLWTLKWEPVSGWTDTEIGIKAESVLLSALGSGHQVLTSYEAMWSEKMGRTSRVVFGAFCDALRSGADPYTGGVPQVARLYRRGAARHIGVLYQGRRYLRGMQVPPHFNLSSVEWRNDLFELCDGVSMERLTAAQHHARPTI